VRLRVAFFAQKNGDRSQAPKWIVCSYREFEERAPAAHPLRAIRRMAGEALVSSYRVSRPSGRCTYRPEPGMTQNGTGERRHK